MTAFEVRMIRSYQARTTFPNYSKMHRQDSDTEKSTREGNTIKPNKKIVQ